jgi:DNA polymerase-3 subunit delta
MPTASPAAVRKQIASGMPDPVYLLQGEDEVEKSALAHEFEALVDEGLRAFNVDVLHAGEAVSGDRLAARIADLVTALKTLPVMAPRRVVLVMQAEGLLAPKRDSEAAARALAQLEDVLASPEPQTTLVLVAGTLDKRSRVYRLLTRQATLVECGVLEDVADAERWVRSHVAASGMRIDPAGARLLAERCGTDVKRLRNDVERLLLYALGQPSIALEDVREVVGASVLQDDWAMTNAIESGDVRVALRQLALMFEAGVPAEKILGQLGWLVRTRFPVTAPGSLRTAVGALFRTDRDLKRSVGEPRAIFERLVVELCAGKAGRPGR